MSKKVYLRHGVFMAPYHHLDEDPTSCLHRDMRLIELLDRLGYAEAWLGEHHSAGYETIASPDLMIAAAAERTKHIRFGTGVASLPYHHPLIMANRMIQLDHMTYGRVVFGAGPGLLVSDATMMGIEPSTQRDRMTESLSAILRLFNGEIVTEKTDWYTLLEARVHLLPYTQPHPEVVVASAVSPSGGRLAGKFDLGMLCVAATDSGFDALGANWRIACDIAAEHGRTMDPDRLRLVGLMHIAETREQARENVSFGLERHIRYFNSLGPQRLAVPEGKDPMDWMNETHRGVIGTPDDAIALIERLQAKQGDFGVFLQQAHDWADWRATERSFELYARFVMPHFRKANRNRVGSYEWIKTNRTEFSGKRQKAVDEMFAKHEKERGDDARTIAQKPRPTSW